jgi:hypothetical protein
MIQSNGEAKVEVKLPDFRSLLDFGSLKWAWPLAGLCLLLLCTGCGADATSGTMPLTAAFPAANDVPGWSLSGEVATFDPDTLFDLVNGQADSFFVYGFAEAAMGSYDGPDGASLRIEIYRLGSPADAYGLFSVSIAGEPVAVGVDGDADPGRRLAFWQDRFYVRIFARQPVADTDLLAFGQAVADALPPDGERPALLNSLPAAGLVPRSARFFHQELSIQNWLWLGGVNLLGLGPETDGLLADYERNGSPARLLLVVYGTSEQATAALAALQASEDVPNLAAVDVEGTTLGAVFGEGTANELLQEALKPAE